MTAISTAAGRLEALVSSPGRLVDDVSALIDGGKRLDTIVGVPCDEGVELLYVFADLREKVVLSVVAPASDPAVPSVTPLLPEADWAERRVRDMFGVRPVGHPRAARLVRHAHWPKGFYPLAAGMQAPQSDEWGAAGKMQLVRVRGEGIHEVPVGPIHAGIIEPGHFRFYADGERIVALEPRLFYVHRGIERLAQDRSVDEALALAERVSGDTTVGHAWAFCSAVEAACGAQIPAQAELARAALLEAERIAAHVTDLGAMLNDIALPAAFTRFLGLREDIMRANGRTFGHRFLRGVLVPGGVRAPEQSPADWAADVAAAGRLAAELAEAWLSRSGVVERFEHTGTLTREAAVEQRAVGLVARASRIPHDARSWSASAAYEGFEPVTQRWGDAMARFLLRLNEVRASADLLESIVADAGPGEVRLEPCTGDGLGSVEGWRGECLHFVRLEQGRVRRWAPQDPSALNWRVLPYAVTRDVIPDFPLVNKSFDLSYAGNDL